MALTAKHVEGFRYMTFTILSPAPFIFIYDNLQFDAQQKPVVSLQNGYNLPYNRVRELRRKHLIRCGKVTLQSDEREQHVRRSNHVVNYGFHYSGDLGNSGFKRLSKHHFFKNIANKKKETCVLNCVSPRPQK